MQWLCLTHIDDLGKYVSVCLYMALWSARGQNTFVACVIGDREVDFKANQ